MEEKNLNDENKIQSNSIIDKIKKLSKVNNNLNLITNNNLNNNDNDNSNNNNNFNNSSGGDLIDLGFSLVERNRILHFSQMFNRYGKKNNIYEI